MKSKTCCMDGCDKLVRARGMCSMHYNRSYNFVRNRSGNLSTTAPDPTAGNTFAESVFLYYLLRLYKQTKQIQERPDIARYISEYPKVKQELEQNVRDNNRWLELG
ncbi:hypothetical protein [Tumebacillus permanentifrigoris]|uniref:Uncharacterized protein n=1 Tax=Tumebacillus permanentifrigoris TaxID=378543 RepID=A0A316DU62_9BACL|nr:hypothetical protein [Tumebacillus permanentifrigoris]PWK11563.1 hypothetical protein C7459_11092 [Tumebacillus permanentifrigoris]